MKRTVCLWVALAIISLPVTWTAGKAMAQAGVAMMVKTDAVREEPLAQTVSVLGRLISPQIGEISAQIGGVVIEIPVRVGDHVKAGDLLFVQDSALNQARSQIIKAEIRQAQAKMRWLQAQLRLTEQELARQKGLRDSGAFSRSRLDTAVQETEKARAAIAEAAAVIIARRGSLSSVELQIARTRVTAPYEGVIIERKTVQGHYLSGGDAALRLAANQEYEIEVDVPSAYATALKSGTQVNAYIGAEGLAGGRAVKAVVRARLPIENPLSRTRPVRFSVDWPPGMDDLAHAQSVTVMIPSGRAVSAATVHKDAVIRKHDGDIVYVAADGKAEARAVVLGRTAGSRLEVISGLKTGDAAIIRGNERLSPGAAVAIDPGA